MIPRPTRSTLFPYTTLFRSRDRTRLLARSRASNNEGSVRVSRDASREVFLAARGDGQEVLRAPLKESAGAESRASARDRKSTRLNSSHLGISYAVFCLKKKT